MLSAQDITGRWELIAWEQLFDDGRRELPMGESPQGFILYQPDGAMACMICRAERKRFELGGQWNAPDDEKARAYDSMLAYAGRFHVDGNTIVHDVE